MINEISQKNDADEYRQAVHNLLDSIFRVQSQFITDSNPHDLFEGLLNDLLSLTQSEYGFIGEILYTVNGDPYLKTHAITNIAWNEEARAFYEKNAPNGFEFYNLKTLFGEVMRTGSPVFANDPKTDPRRGGLPKGHPPLHRFLGLPFYKGEKLVGMVGIANRISSYDEELVEYLQPLLATCANIIEAYRNDQQRQRAEETLRIKTEQLKAVTEAMKNFLEKGNWKEVSTILLRCALVQTSSEYGFAGVVVAGPILRILAHEGISWDKGVNHGFYEKAIQAYKEIGYLEFSNLENLFGRVVTSGKVVISNNPGTDPRSGGLPPGHPPLHHFLGVPILRGTEVVGMIGVANREGGYTGTEQSQIEILSQAAGVLYDSYRRKEREILLEEKRKRAEEALADQAIRDSLTNLYNRRYFNSSILEEIKRADRTRKPLAILLCDLDHFKAVNDNLGHHAGDEVLKEVAIKIQGAVRGTDLVFRWGGDEIVVLLSNTTREGVLTGVERIRESVHKIKSKNLGKQDLSIGVVIYPEHGRTVEELMHLADRALYIAKKGGDNFHIGAEEYGLNEQSIKVVFQPIVDARSNKNWGYEALSRDPKGKLSILDLFKKYQAVGQLNELKLVCFRSQLKVAQDIELERVFINVDFNLLSDLEPLDKPSTMDVILEISEREALLEVENHLKITRKWRKKGFKLAIDDFGAGFISLPFIAQLVPDYIKLDRSIILQAVTSKKFRVFCKDLVHALQNYTTEGIIAEGIEKEKELQVIQELGINLAQGFLFGKPKEMIKESVISSSRMVKIFKRNIL